MLACVFYFCIFSNKLDLFVGTCSSILDKMTIGIDVPNKWLQHSSTEQMILSIMTIRITALNPMNPNDILHNDILHNDILHNDILHNDTWHIHAYNNDTHHNFLSIQWHSENDTITFRIWICNFALSFTIMKS